MSEILSVEPEDEAIRRRLARLQSGHADVRGDAERLRGESRRLAEHYASVRAVTRAQWDARRAALNLLEDAEEARSAERRELAERRRADAALRASEEKYRALFERMDEAYCVIEMIFDQAERPVDFVMLDANPAFAAQTGLRMTGRRIREVIPDYEQLWLDNYGRVATTGEPMRFEGFVRGVGRWFEASAFRLGGDESLRVAVLFTNITARKETEERLRRAAGADAFRVALADALRPLHDPVEIQEAAARIVGQHLGASRAHYAEIDGDLYAVERGYTDAVPPFSGRFPLAAFAPAFVDAWRAGQTLAIPDVARHVAVAAGHLRELEGRSVAALIDVPLVKNGRLVGSLVVHQCEPRHWTDDEVALVEEAAERIWSSVERARAQAALRESEARFRALAGEAELARAEAVAAGRAKDHFLAVLSHELRTPLTPIQMALGTLSRRSDLPATVRAAHDMIARNVELEAHFIDDMLDMTRIARGKMEIVREPMDLHEAARRAVEVSLPDLEAKKQRLTVALEATEPRLDADFARLQQAMWNLLKNASKFTPEGGAISLRTRDLPGGSLAVEVADTGIGMDPAVIERVFNPFEQADLSITQRFGGLGLGLAIAKGTVEAHGGELRASSAGPGRGATFTMCLPLRRPAADF